MALAASTWMLICLGILACLSGIHAETFNVGDSTNWNVDPSYNYTEWASKTNVKVGDILVFKYPADSHDVRRVTAQQYEACDDENYVEAWSSGEDSVVLNSTGSWYFLCSKPQHCSFGQRFSISVKAADEETPEPPPASILSPPPPSSSVTPPSPPSSAPSLLPSLAGLSALTTVVLSFVGCLC